MRKIKVGSLVRMFYDETVMHEFAFLEREFGIIVSEIEEKNMHHLHRCAHWRAFKIYWFGNKLTTVLYETDLEVIS